MKQPTAILMLLSMVFLLTSCSFQDVDIIEDLESRPSATAPVSTDEVTATYGLQTDANETTEVPAPVLPPVPQSDDVFVRVADYIPGLAIDLKYAGTENFTGKVIYESQEAWLRYGTVKKLILVQQELNEMGYGLKLWDGFRPPSAQYKLWEICPDPTYVSNPNNGFSNHSRGNTVDITLVNESGNEIEMPTGFDDFTTKADRDYSDCTAAAAENARMLETIMVKHGFKGYYGEWWHYTDCDSYEVEHEFVP